ncbi:hypothetical protein [Helicobacter suis]|uniref:hypothetical protein n=1 Tax=Helicobacter suis TaxID=104628 RepID=UPI0013D784AB|nr:hypothetical protein [Helicobacter suis]
MQIGYIFNSGLTGVQWWLIELNTIKKASMEDFLALVLGIDETGIMEFLNKAAGAL